MLNWDEYNKEETKQVVSSSSSKKEDEKSANPEIKSDLSKTEIKNKEGSRAEKARESLNNLDVQAGIK